MYFLFSTLLAILGMYNTSTMTASLNALATFQKIGLLCYDSKSKLHRMARIGMLCIIFQLLMIAVHDVIIGLFISEDYENSFDNTFYNLVHNLPSIFLFMFCAVCCIYVRLFMCYQSLMKAVLDKETIYRVNDYIEQPFDDNYCCSAYHVDIIEGKNLEEELDVLRRLHESIRVALMASNEAFNPQLTCFMIIELGVLVMHLYSIILFFQLEPEDIESNAILFMDVVFVIAHTVGVILFLSCAHRVKVVQAGPYQHLQKVSNRKLSSREFLQLKLFQIKLDATPAQFTSGRLSIIDISLLAPIAGSVVTYLMVALQIKKRSVPTISTPDLLLSNSTAE
ncbi:hypothetical protein DMENIID0001_162060 [Sergentomyia squamirostris]